MDNMTRPIAGGRSPLNRVTAFDGEGDGAMTGTGQTTGYILSGIAMLRNPTLGRGLGGPVVVLALIALAGLYLLGIDSLLYAPLGLFVLILPQSSSDGRSTI